jgi:hypothetical protein
MNCETIHSSGRANVGKPRFLVVANETIDAATLRDVIGRRAESAPRAEVLVIAPALNSRLRYWLSDEDQARRSACLRLAESLERLRAAGIEAAGRIGDPDPVQAITDALHEYSADLILIPSEREGRSHWLARDLVERAQRRFGQPIVQIVVEQSDNSAIVPPYTSKAQRKPSAKRAVTRRTQEAGT